MASKSARGRPSRQAIYRQLAEGVEELRARLGGLPTPVEAEDISGDIWYQEAHNSTAIEGNTLVLKEVEALLSEGRAVGAKQLTEYLEVRGFAGSMTIGRGGIGGIATRTARRFSPLGAPAARSVDGNGGWQSSAKSPSCQAWRGGRE